MWTDLSVCWRMIIHQRYGAFSRRVSSAHAHAVFAQRRKFELRFASGGGVALPVLSPSRPKRVAEEEGEVARLAFQTQSVVPAFAARCRLYVEKIHLSIDSPFLFF